MTDPLNDPRFLVTLGASISALVIDALVRVSYLPFSWALIVLVLGATAVVGAVAFAAPSAGVVGIVAIVLYVGAAVLFVVNPFGVVSTFVA